MRLRVVCGFEETIATLRPTSELTSVDFPALGRPTTAINPDLNVTSPHDEVNPRHSVRHLNTPRLRGARRSSRAKPQHLALISFKYFKLQAVIVDSFTSRRYVPRHAIQKPRKSRGTGILLRLGNFESEKLLQLLHRNAAAQNQAPGRLANHVRRRRSISILNFADNFFHQIFDGHNP